jgi:DNA-directed RNA polymerase specialized sigma24 family protein
MPPVQQGDEVDLYREHSAGLVRLLRGRLRLDDDQAAEVAAIAWLRFLEKQPARDNVFGWLYTTAKHEAFARWRQLRREPLLDEVVEPAEDLDLAAQLDRAELTKRLADVFAGWLTHNQRAALWLWAQDYSYREIAAELGKTYTWTNRHISEGLRVLRAVFGWEAASAEQLRHEALRHPLVAEARARPESKAG